LPLRIQLRISPYATSGFLKPETGSLETLSSTAECVSRGISLTCIEELAVAAGNLSGLVFLLFVISQFLASFTYSNIATVVTVKMVMPWRLQRETATAEVCRSSTPRRATLSPCSTR
jgi:hypothetical protein